MSDAGMGMVKAAHIPGWHILAQPCSESERGDGTQSHILEHAQSITYQGQEASDVILPFLGNTGEKLTFVGLLLGTQSSSTRSLHQFF